MTLQLLDPLGVFVGLYAIVTGVGFAARPQTMFRLRHWLSVTRRSELSEFGVLRYRFSGVLAILLGCWLLYDWGNLDLLLSSWL